MKVFCPIIFVAFLAVVSVLFIPPTVEGCKTEYHQCSGSHECCSGLKCGTIHTMVGSYNGCSEYSDGIIRSKIENRRTPLVFWFVNKMADSRMQGDDQWRTHANRQKIVQRLEEAMRNSPNPMPKTSAEMEEYVFSKARSRDEYLDFVARVLLSVQEHKDKKGGQGMGPSAAGQQGMVGTGMAGPGPGNMAGPTAGMVPGGAMGGPTAGMGGPGTGNMGGGVMAGPSGGMVGPGGGMVGPGGGMGGPVGSMAGPSQGGPDPINALTNLAGQGAGGMVRQQPGMMSGMHNMGPGAPPMMDQSHMMRAPRMRAPISQKPSPLTRQDAFMVTSPQTMPGVQGQALPASSASMVYPGPGGVRPMGMYMANRDVQMGSMPVQSPAQGSPVTMMPSPHQPGMMQSPMMRPPMGPGVPSPSTMLHTPGNAYADPSPGPPSQSQEEMEYVKKLEKLSKYIEPLRKMLVESEKKTDEESKRNRKKIQSLLDILSNPQKRRIPIDVLEKCEQVLLKMTSSASSSNANGHMCQPLLDAVAHFSSATSLNHSLYRTFGPALEAYMGPPIKGPSPPPSRKRKAEKKENPEELPDLLQGEIARLASRFIVSVDPKKHTGSERHHLVCKLEDPRLPSVPPLLVTIPKTYPHSSPECEPADCPGYDATEFFQNVEKNLTVFIASMSYTFCLTMLLNKWEMSVRKACDPEMPLIAHDNPIFI